MKGDLSRKNILEELRAACKGKAPLPRCPGSCSDCLGTARGLSSWEALRGALSKNRPDLLLSKAEVPGTKAHLSGKVFFSVELQIFSSCLLWKRERPIVLTPKSCPHRPHSHQCPPENSPAPRPLNRPLTDLQAGQPLNP